MQPLEFQYLCFPFSHFCLSALAAQPLPEMAAVTITSAMIMKIEEVKMLASRQTASRADGVIRLHNVAPPPTNPLLPHRGDRCSKCKCSCGVRPLNNIALEVVLRGSRWLVPCPPRANRTLITVWQRRRVRPHFPISHESLRY